jgi:hypothetical protein
MKEGGPFIGVLMLDTAFPRPLGDAGNSKSYGVPARLRVVPKAETLEIVRDGLPAEALVQGFIAAARALEAEGAVAIVSTCGFLILVQRRIAASVSVPVMLSAMSLLPLVKAVHGGAPVGVLTASAAQLGPEMLEAAGVSKADVRIAGLEACSAFSQAILVPKELQPATLDEAAIGAAVVAKAQALCAATPEISALVLECGNLPPYAAAIEMATGRPVYSILDGARLIAARGFPG